MEDELDRLGCDLYIYTGTKSPKYITEKTGVMYSEIHEAGKPWFNYKTNEVYENRIYEENIWILTYEIQRQNEDIYLDHPLSKLLEIILPKEDLFKEFFFDENYKALIFCYEYAYDYHLYFRLDPELLNLVNKLNLSLNFDLYSFNKENV